MSRRLGPSPELIYEKHLQSARSLENELERLDGDAGIRVSGTFHRVRCFAFTTRFGSTYTVLVYSVKGGQRKTPGRRLASKEFPSARKASSFLKSLARSKLDAVAY